MKKVIFCVALTLSSLPVGYVSAQNYTCTTEFNLDSRCYSCSLYEFNHNVLQCAAIIETNGGYDRVGVEINIDNCVENFEGKMVHGLGAGDSCENYQLDNDELHAQCRTGTGEYKPTFINISEFFVLELAGLNNDPVLKCAQ